jgi:hypothetical protein
VPLEVKTRTLSSVPVTVPPVAASVPPDSDRPVPTLISSIAPLLAVVRPRRWDVFIVRPDEPTAPDAAAPRLLRAFGPVVAPVPPLATATVPVTLAAVPVVFWFRVGMSAATRARNVGAPAVPFGAAKIVLAVWDCSVAVSVPLPVTGDPDTENNAGRPRPTLVTLPLPVPAPMADRKSAALRDETVLSALNRGNVTALGFVAVNRLLPSVVAPRLVRAAAAVFDPVPPCATERAVVSPERLVMSLFAPALARDAMNAAGTVMKMSRVPADQLTAAPPLLDARIVVRASVFPVDQVPRPTSQPLPLMSTAA